MGAGYHGGFGHTKGAERHEEYSLKNQTTIENNVKTMHFEFPLTNGKFGVKGRNCQVIYCKNQYETALRFYKLISMGGEEKDLPNKKGKIVIFSDKTKIIYRKHTSTKDSPAVEISINYPSHIKKQKIHFEMER